MKETALNTQVGGSHYKDMVIQPVEFIERNNLGFCVGNVIKYVCRYKSKNGIEDLEKAKHYLDILIDIEKDKNNELESVEIPIEPVDEQGPVDERGSVINDEDAVKTGQVKVDGKDYMSGWDAALSNFEINTAYNAECAIVHKPTYEPELQEIEAMKEELRHKSYKQN